MLHCDPSETPGPPLPLPEVEMLELLALLKLT